MDRFRNLTAWPVWVEVTGYIGNKTKISSLSIDRQLKFQLTAWQKWEIKLYRMGISPQSTQAVISLQWRCLLWHLLKPFFTFFFADKLQSWEVSQSISDRDGPVTMTPRRHHDAQRAHFGGFRDLGKLGECRTLFWIITYVTWLQGNPQIPRVRSIHPRKALTL